MFFKNNKLEEVKIIDFNTDILESLDNFKAFLNTNPSKEFLGGSKNHIDDFMSDAYDDLDLKTMKLLLKRM